MVSCGRPPRSLLPGPPDGPIKISPVIQSVAPASWLLAVLEPRRSRALTLTPALPRAAASSAASARVSRYGGDSADARCYGPRAWRGMEGIL